MTTPGPDGLAGGLTDDALAAEPHTDDPRPTRSAALALARLHLRTGALALARTELETLAGRDGLDDAGVLDLAEVRWRTGDIAGAGEAVTALLEGASDGDPVAGSELPIAWVIAAEAAAARGRPTEARRHAERLRSVDSVAIDAIFAGALRSSAWPPDPLTLVPGDATFFAPVAEGDRSRRTGDVPAGGSASRSSLAAAETQATGSPGLWDLEAAEEASGEPTLDEPPEIDPELAAVAEAIAATDAIAEADMDFGGASPIWERTEVVDEADEVDDAAGADLADDAAGDDSDADPDLDPDAALDGPDPVDGLDAGRSALAAGDPAAAAVHLGLVLRLAPALAPQVLEIVGADDDPGLAFVRGDAYRLVGREREARKAYVRARPSTPSPDPRIGDAPTPGGIDDPDPSQGDPA